MVIGPHGAGMANLIFARPLPIPDARDAVMEAMAKGVHDRNQYFESCTGEKRPTPAPTTTAEMEVEDLLPSSRVSPLRYRRFSALVELHPTYGNWGTKELANQCQQITAHAVGMYTVQIRQQGGSRFANFSVNVTRAVEAVAEMLEKIQESEMLFVQWQQ